VEWWRDGNKAKDVSSDTWPWQLHAVGRELARMRKMRLHARRTPHAHQGARPVLRDVLPALFAAIQRRNRQQGAARRQP